MDEKKLTLEERVEQLEERWEKIDLFVEAFEKDLIEWKNGKWHHKEAEG